MLYPLSYEGGVCRDCGRELYRWARQGRFGCFGRRRSWPYALDEPSKELELCGQARLSR